MAELATLAQLVVDDGIEEEDPSSESEHSTIDEAVSSDRIRFWDFDSSLESLSTTVLSTLAPAVQLPIPATSRFSTVVGNRETERMVIDLESDEENCGRDDNEDSGSEGGSSLQACSYAPQGTGGESPSPTPSLSSNSTNWVSPPSTPPPSISLTPQEPPEANALENSAVLSARTELDTEPPFVTDGRGRVVWSSSRVGSARRK
jgi:E3 ubiquitin-protein ligase makorin